MGTPLQGEDALGGPDVYLVGTRKPLLGQPSGSLCRHGCIWSSSGHEGLVTNYREGGGHKTEGGHVKFYPYKKGGEKKF